MSADGTSRSVDTTRQHAQPLRFATPAAERLRSPLGCADVGQDCVALPGCGLRGGATVARMEDAWRSGDKSCHFRRVASGMAKVMCVSIALVGWKPAAPRLSVIPVRVEVEATEPCATGEALAEGLRLRSARVRLANPQEEATVVRVRVTRLGARVRGELKIVGSTGETDSRVVDGATCQEVIQALSLTGALALDPSANLEETPVEPVAAPPAPCDNVTNRPETSQRLPESPPPARAVPVPPIDPESERRWGFEIAVAGRAVQLSSPVVSFGGSIEGRFRWRPDRGVRHSALRGLLRLGPSIGIAWMTASNEVLQSGGAAGLTWNGVLLSGCFGGWNKGSRYSIEPCLLGMGGMLRGVGRGVSAPISVTRSWWSLGGALRMGVALSPALRLEGEAGLEALLVERRFTLSEARLVSSEVASESTVAHTPAVSPVLGLGMAFRW